MKRLVVFTALILLLVAMLVPASAASIVSDEYVFSLDSGAFVCSDTVPSGRYNLFLSTKGVDYSGVVSFREIKGSDGRILFISDHLDWMTDISGSSDRVLQFIHIPRGSQISFYDLVRGFRVAPPSDCVIKLVPVNFRTQVAKVSFSGVLDQVVSLLPVLLVFLVGFIAIRKAVSWLISVLRSS